MLELSSFKYATSRLSIAGLKNDKNIGSPVIALHGWLDNAASFVPLSKFIVTDRPFFAIDLPGHGLSDHRPSSSSYHLVENILDVISFVDHISKQNVAQEKVTLLGHSLGGIIACLVAATAPDRVKDIILIDSLGPLTDEIANVLPQLKRAVERAMQLTSKISIFPTLEIAVRARMAGIGKISKEAAEHLVQRGLKSVEGGFSWTTDPKLLKPSFLRFSEEQVRAIFSGIDCPVKLIRGHDGYFQHEQQLKRRVEYFKDFEHVMVEGGHHFHMDGDVIKTAEYINAYLGS